MIHHYKFQWNVVEAVQQLINERGYNLSLNLVGGAKPAVLEKMRGQLEECKHFVKYHGKVDYEKIEQFYHHADIFVFASTCENMPNILIEAMSANLRISCSNYGPMPEILGDAGVYFDPEQVLEIKKSVIELIEDKNSVDLAEKAYEYAESFTWDKTADQTFEFLKSIVE